MKLRVQLNFVSSYKVASMDIVINPHKYAEWLFGFNTPLK